MNSQKSMIFFGAHPDDETFGLGGTLARYSLAGVKVYYACATRGEAGTVDSLFMADRGSIAEVRTCEMESAAQKLGLSGVIYLGYRDSGMPGSPDNGNPEALINAPVEQVTGRMVKIIRELKPGVVITHDAGGGYGHPDHIAVHNAAVKAFYAAGDDSQYPEAGPAFKPQKLYYIVHPRGSMKLAIHLMPLFGQDPKHFGRNKDIDFTKIIGVDFPVNTVIRLSKKAVKMRDDASSCHASQLGGRRSRSFIFRILGFIESLRGPRDHFIRAYPPPSAKREFDLYEDISG
jgi:LmbE family N-acetylglucosaminyl deacetylase